MEIPCGGFVTGSCSIFRPRDINVPFGTVYLEDFVETFGRSSLFLLSYLICHVGMSLWYTGMFQYIT